MPEVRSGFYCLFSINKVQDFQFFRLDLHAEVSPLVEGPTVDPEKVPDGGPEVGPAEGPGVDPWNGPDEGPPVGPGDIPDGGPAEGPGDGPGVDPENGTPVGSLHRQSVQNFLSITCPQQSPPSKAQFS